MSALQDLTNLKTCKLDITSNNLTDKGFFNLDRLRNLHDLTELELSFDFNNI